VSYSDANSSDHSLIANNSIGGEFRYSSSTCYGIDIYSNVTYVDVLYNSVYCDQATGYGIWAPLKTPHYPSDKDFRIF